VSGRCEQVAKSRYHRRVSSELGCYLQELVDGDTVTMRIRRENDLGIGDDGTRCDVNRESSGSVGGESNGGVVDISESSGDAVGEVVIVGDMTGILDGLA